MENIEVDEISGAEEEDLGQTSEKCNELESDLGGLSTERGSVDIGLLPYNPSNPSCNTITYNPIGNAEVAAENSVFLSTDNIDTDNIKTIALPVTGQLDLVQSRNLKNNAGEQMSAEIKTISDSLCGASYDISSEHCGLSVFSKLDTSVIPGSEKSDNDCCAFILKEECSIASLVSERLLESNSDLTACVTKTHSVVNLTSGASSTLHVPVDLHLCSSVPAFHKCDPEKTMNFHRSVDNFTHGPVLQTNENELNNSKENLSFNSPSHLIEDNKPPDKNILKTTVLTKAKSCGDLCATLGDDDRKAAIEIKCQFREIRTASQRSLSLDNLCHFVDFRLQTTRIINFADSAGNDSIVKQEVERTKIVYDLQMPTEVLTVIGSEGGDTRDESNSFGDLPSCALPSILKCVEEKNSNPRKDVSIQQDLSSSCVPLVSTGSSVDQRSEEIKVEVERTLLQSGNCETEEKEATVIICSEESRNCDLFDIDLLQKAKKSIDVAALVEEHLKDIYVPFDSVKVQLIRQSRDILLCKYQGNFKVFEENFLIHATNLLRRLKSEYAIEKDKNGDSLPACSHVPCLRNNEGWPLCFDRRLVVHLGELDPSFLKPGDFYFCIKADLVSVGSVYLSFGYRGGGGEILEHRIDEKDFGSFFFAMDWIQAVGSKVMIADDQLTNVLQHLLLSVERGIERLEWDGPTTKPWCTSTCNTPTSPTSRCCHINPAVDTKDCSVQTSLEEEGPNGTKTASDPTVKENERTAQQTGPSKTILHIENGKCDVNGNVGLEGADHIVNSVSQKDKREDLSLPLLTDASRDDEPDDGYYEQHVTLTQPTTISQVDPDLLHSQIALLPGCRDLLERSVVLISGTAQKDSPAISACHLAQLLLYFHTIPKKDVISKGFLILIDAADPGEDFWNVLDETFCLLEANVSNSVSQVILWCPNNNLDPGKIFLTSRIQFEVIHSQEKLLNYVSQDQLLPVYGGSYVYDHQEWISFRKFLEPFINGCRLSGRQLVTLLEELRGSRLPSSSTLTHHMIEQQKRRVTQTFRDEQLRHLEEEGETILKELESYRTKSPHNADYRENLERTSVLYEELRKAMSKLSRLADKRLHRLEECLQMRTFQEESSQVLSWLCRKGTESLEKHQAVADTLGGIKQQEEEFEKFYFLAMRQIEKGNDLLEEVVVLGQEPHLPKIKEEIPPPVEPKGGEGGVQELATSLRRHLGSFTEQLEGTRERIEDTAKCYQLMDKSYEWALEAMRFVSRMGLTNTESAEAIARQIRSLQDYLEDHLPVSDETFMEMIEIATRLNNEKLLEQCKIAKMKCQETVDLIQARQATLFKVKQQMEIKSFRVPLWDADDNAATPRTTRCHSQPSNIWSPTGTSTPYAFGVIGHHRRRSTSSTGSSVQMYGSPVGSYTSFPNSYFPTAKESYQMDCYIQEKEEQLLQHGLITEDLTYQGPVASISKNLLESRTTCKEGASSSSSSSSTSSSCSNSNNNKGVISVLRSSGRLNSAVGCSSAINRWARKSTRKCQSWQLREEALEKVKAEVREQNTLLRTERLSVPRDGSTGSVTSNSETDFSPTTESCAKVPVSHTRSDSVQGPVPVNTHLLPQNSTTDILDSGGGGDSEGAANDVEAKSKKTLMLIMNEMIQTERDYVKSLEYIIENYIPELLREDIPQALRGQRNVMFGNIEKIYEFHSQYFLNELEQCENVPFTVGQCFLNYEPQFYLYALYNKNKPKSDTLMAEYGNAFFRKKQLELEDKMDLASYLLKPVQRMGKYALLLKQLLKECPEREAEHQDLKAAEEMVRFQLRHGNDLLAMDALRDCDVNVKEQGRLLCQDEFLVWQGRSRKCMRHVFLFEDLILFSKARRDTQRKGYEMYQYKHSIKTTDMGLTEQVGDSPTKFEIWFRKRKLNDTYVLQAPSPDIKAAWVHELSKLLWKQALRNREMRLAEMSSMGIGNKPCLDIKPSEDQISDRSISVHQLARAPRFRNSIAVSPYDIKNNKRPHSIISVSSSSSSGSSQSSFTFYGTLNLGFEPGDSPRPLHRSLTQQSHCSTESGFCTDASTAGDSPVDSDHPRHKKAERSDSLLSSDSASASLSPSDSNCSPCDDQGIEESITTSM